MIASTSTWMGLLSDSRWMMSNACFTMRTASSFLPLLRPCIISDAVSLHIRSTHQTAHCRPCVVDAGKRSCSGAAQRPRSCCRSAHALRSHHCECPQPSNITRTSPQWDIAPCGSASSGTAPTCAGHTPRTSALLQCNPPARCRSPIHTTQKSALVVTMALSALSLQSEVCVRPSPQCHHMTTFQKA